MITLYIVRHGETDYNKEGRYSGRMDIALNTTGHEQAKGLIRNLQDCEIDNIASSPLNRALETAEIINGVYKKDIIVDNRFIERSKGIYEGLTRQEAEEKFPILWAKDLTRIFDDGPSEGETIRQVQERVFDGLDEISKIYNGQNILIVTHSFVARVINKYFNPNLSDEEFFNFVLDNAHIQVYQIE